MEALELEPSVSNDGVIFALSVCGRDVTCVVTRETLEQHFWVQPGATDARVLKAFSEGRRRIVALAERKARARPGERIVLTVDDFDPGTSRAYATGPYASAGTLVNRDGQP